MKLGYFDKHFVKTQEKEAPQGYILEIFLLYTVLLKLHFEWKI